MRRKEGRRGLLAEPGSEVRTKGCKTTMAVKEELLDFKDRYHAYIEASAQLKAHEEAYAHILEISPDVYYEESDDEVVTETRKLSGEMLDGIAVMAGAIEEERGRKDRAARDTRDKIARLRDRAASDQAEFERRERDATDKRDESASAIEDAASRIASNSRKLKGGIVAAKSILVILATLAAMLGVGVVAFASLDMDPGVGTIGKVILAVAAAAFALAAIGAWPVDPTGEEKDKDEGQDAGLDAEGCLWGLWFVGSIIAIIALFKAENEAGIIVAATGAGFNALLFAVGNVVTRSKRHVYRKSRLESELAVDEELQDKATVQHSVAIGELEDIVRARQEATGYFATQTEKLERENDALQAELTESIARKERLLKDSRGYYDDTVAPLVATAKERSSVLQGLETGELQQAIAQDYADVARLRDEMLALVESNENLPQEDDWAAIDAIYDAVRRHYAETLKEALQYCREEVRHKELMSGLAGVFEELKEIREQAAEQTAELIVLDGERNRLIEKQIARMEEQAGIASAGNAQRETLIMQGKVALTQHETIIAGNKLLAQQNERMQALAEQQIDVVHDAASAVVITNLIGAVASYGAGKRVERAIRSK